MVISMPSRLAFIKKKMWVLGIELRFSCLWGKHSTDQTLSPAPEVGFLVRGCWFSGQIGTWPLGSSWTFLHHPISLVTLDESASVCPFLNWRWWQQLPLVVSGDELGQSSAQGLAPLGCADSPKDYWRTAHHRAAAWFCEGNCCLLLTALPASLRDAWHLERLPSQSPSDLDPAWVPWVTVCVSLQFPPPWLLFQFQGGFGDKNENWLSPWKFKRPLLCLLPHPIPRCLSLPGCQKGHILEIF